MSSSLPQRLRGLWREARANNARPMPSTEARFDPNSWSGALIVMGAVTGLLWVVQLANAGADYGLNRFGLRPREVGGLWGIVTEPLLHESYAQLGANTLPVLLVGWAVMIAGLRNWLMVTGIIVVLGGAGTWLAAPSGLIVGASSLVFGWLGYLIARAYFSRKVRWIVTAVVVLLIFGSLLGELLPSYRSSVSWQAHLAGFVAGLVAGAALHPRRRPRQRPRRRTARVARRADGAAPVS